MSWKPMSEAPRDGTYILVKPKGGPPHHTTVRLFFEALGSGRWIDETSGRFFNGEQESHYVFAEIPEDSASELSAAEERTCCQRADKRRRTND